MPYYVKVTPEVKSQILPDYVVKPKAKDGNYLLFQTDLIGVPGNTLQERVDHVGGALLTPDERRAEGLGTANPPAKCYTPSEYGGTDTHEESSDADNTKGSSQPSATVDVVIPPVIGESSEENVNNNTDESDADKAEDESKSSTRKESEVSHE